LEMAADPKLDVLWIARGGYGATRLLPALEEWTAEHGAPPYKLLVGYSDATALHAFVQRRWGWSTLHGPMPGLRSFCKLSEDELSDVRGWMEGAGWVAPWSKRKLRFWTEAPAAPIEAELVGGNLTVLSALVGTPFMPALAGKFLFLEDVD